MRLNHIIQSVYFDPVCITEAGHAAVRTVIENKLGFKSEDKEDGTDFFGDPIPKPYDLGATRVIPVHGTIGYKVGGIEKSCGVCDALEVKQWVKEAVNAPTVTGVILDISSPGGTVTGVPELADFIKECTKQKPIVAFTNDQMASAAMWIGAAANEIYATPTANVGSIGVYSYFLNLSKVYENMGVEVNLFKDGKYKGMGMPGLPLSDDQKVLMQDNVNKISALFKGFIKERRPSVKDETMQGQTLMGYEAVEAGLIDAVVTDIEDILQGVTS